MGGQAFYGKAVAGIDHVQAAAFFEQPPGHALVILVIFGHDQGYPAIWWDFTGTDSDLVFTLEDLPLILVPGKVGEMEVDFLGISSGAGKQEDEKQYNGQSILFQTQSKRSCFILNHITKYSE